ncbi:MAG: hypothetical protein ACK40X_14965, partial [Armatimonadota bacterium]
MHRWGSGPANGEKQILTVENDAAFVRALTRALRLSFFALLVSANDPVAGILTTLQDKSSSADVLYLDAQLVYQECPDPSYYGGLELFKHIWLTPSLEPLSPLPIVMGTVDATGWLTQQAKVVELPRLLINLWEALQRGQRFSGYEQALNAIKPFVLFTEDDQRTR